MEIIIKGEPEEIAGLVLAVQIGRKIHLKTTKRSKSVFPVISVKK